MCFRLPLFFSLIIWIVCWSRVMSLKVVSVLVGCLNQLFLMKGFVFPLVEVKISVFLFLFFPLHIVDNVQIPYVLVLSCFCRPWNFLHLEPVPRWIFYWKTPRGLFKTVLMILYSLEESLLIGQIFLFPSYKSLLSLSNSQIFRRRLCIRLLFRMLQSCIHMIGHLKLSSQWVFNLILFLFLFSAYFLLLFIFIFIPRML